MPASKRKPGIKYDYNTFICIWQQETVHKEGDWSHSLPVHPIATFCFVYFYFGFILLKSAWTSK